MSADVHGIALVISGSRGNRLVFFHSEEKGSVREALLRELSPKILAELLIPNPGATNQQFELIVDHWKFLGHSKTCSHGDAQLMFNVVFILKASAVSSCSQLVDKLTAALAHEEHRVGYLSEQSTVMLDTLEEEGDDTITGLLSAYQCMLGRSSLADCLQRVLRSVVEGKLYVTERVNNWSLVSVLQPATTGRQLPLGSIVRPYHTILLLEDGQKLLSELPPYCSPTFMRLLREVSSQKSLEQISVDADLPLGLVLQLVEHLVHWGKAIAASPISENNVYSTSQHAQVIMTQLLKMQFEQEFRSCSLIEFLSHFSQPIPLRDHQMNLSGSDAGNFAHMVAWLLQRQLIIQLHIYVFILPVYSKLLDMQEYEMIAELSQHVTPPDGDSDLRNFAQLATYFRGSHHLEEIMYLRNLTRSQLLTLLDKFSSILVTCTLPAHSI